MCAGLIAQSQFARDDLRFKTQDDHENLVPIRVNDQLIRVAVYPGQTRRADLQAGLLPNLPFTGLGRAFAGFHVSAGQAPAAVVCTLGELHFFAFTVKYDPATANSQLALPA